MTNHEQEPEWDTLKDEPILPVFINAAHSRFRKPPLDIPVGQARAGACDTGRGAASLGKLADKELLNQVVADPFCGTDCRSRQPARRVQVIKVREPVLLSCLYRIF